jgi:hypothetical protein
MNNPATNFKKIISFMKGENAYRDVATSELANSELSHLFPHTSHDRESDALEDAVTLRSRPVKGDDGVPTVSIGGIRYSVRRTRQGGVYALPPFGDRLYLGKTFREVKSNLLMLRNEAVSQQYDA